MIEVYFESNLKRVNAFYRILKYHALRLVEILRYLQKMIWQ